MLVNYNIFGEDFIDIAENSLAERVGDRIRKIREGKVPKMTQDDLGKLVGLNGKRMQQYESGARRPRPELIKAIAAALGVEAMALVDPVPSFLEGTMYCLFEMEDINWLDLRLKKIDDQIYLCFGDEESRWKTQEINEYLEKWYERQIERNMGLEAVQSEEGKKEVLLEYNMWKNTFPGSLSLDSKIAYLERVKKMNDKELEKLKKIKEGAKDKK